VSTRATAAKRRVAKPRELPAEKNKFGFLKSESFILGALLFIATLAVYLPVDHHPFVNYDDPAYVQNNPHLGSGLSWQTIAWSFSTFYQFNWHPVTWLSHALDVQMYQLDPAGHHVTNMLIQLVNVLLLFWVLRRATGYVGRSAMVAGLFALHPINVESVAWISERKNLLSMFFFLLGMGAYRWYVSSPTQDAPAKKRNRSGAANADLRPSRARYAVMTLCFVLGLMSKPQIITFPFILLLWDYWPLQRLAIAGEERGAKSERRFWWLVKEKIPLFVICAIFAVVTLAAQTMGGAVASLQVYPFSVRWGNTIVSYVRYLGKAFWPVRLAPLYPHPWHPLPLSQVIPALIALLAITAGVIALRSRRYLLVGWFWFLGSLVPMIGLVHVGNQAMADRYAYLPFIGLFIMVCWGVAELARGRVPIMTVRVVSFIVLAALAFQTHRQLSYWNDNMTLWRHTLAVTEDNYIAHDNLAMLLMDQGQSDEALKHYQAALAIFASDPSSNLAIAVYDHQHGNYHGAVARYDQMIRITGDGPARSELFSNRGLVYFDMRDDADARQSLQTAVAMDPKNARGWLGLGMVADRAGDPATAISYYNHANSIKPMRVTYQLLAKALDATGRTAEAQAARERARLLSADQTTTHSYSGAFPSTK
jgi:protein O-mannosyl-transferase